MPQVLYDLAHDPGERYDVQTLYPDILTRMLALAEDARNDLGDDLTNRTVVEGLLLALVRALSTAWRGE